MKHFTILLSTAMVTVAAVSPLSAQQQGQQQQQTQAPAQTTLTNKQRAELAKALAGVDATNPEAVTKAVLGIIAQYPSLAPLFTGEAIKTVTANPAVANNPTTAASVVSAVVSAVVATYPAAAQPIVSAAVKAVPATLKPSVVPAVVDKSIAAVSTPATKAAVLNGAKEAVGTGTPSLIAKLDQIAQDNNIKIDENSDSSGNARYSLADASADSLLSGDLGTGDVGAAPLPSSGASGGSGGSSSNPGATGNQPAPSSAG